MITKSDLEHLHVNIVAVGSQFVLPQGAADPYAVPRTMGMENAMICIAFFLFFLSKISRLSERTVTMNQLTTEMKREKGKRLIRSRAMSIPPYKFSKSMEKKRKMQQQNLTV